MERPRPAHYFDAAPTARSARRTVPLALADLTLELVTDRGVFSAERVDPGTRFLLIEGPPPPPAGDVLDLGCGYGPIAVTLARRGAERVWAVDVNERARALTAENAAAAGVGDRVQVVAPEDVPEAVRFAGIWSNPPVRIGKAALHELLARWLGRLGDGAHAQLVVHRHLGADSLQRWLTEQGWPTTRAGSRAGYRLLDVMRGQAQ